MQRYFSVYAAILGILAILLFLSPQIAKFISADTQLIGQEILKANDFTTGKLDKDIWPSILANDQNKVEVSTGALEINNTLSKDNYSLLMQRLTLSADRYYLLKIVYSWQNNSQPGDKASFGVMKNGQSNPSALIYDLQDSKSSTTVTKFFRPNISFTDPYLYVLLQGTGSLRIEQLSLLEFNKRPANLNTSDQNYGEVLPIKLSGYPVSHQPVRSPQKSQVTLTPTPLQSLNPSLAAIYPGWNIVLLGTSSTSEPYTKAGLTVFQMFGSKWTRADKNSQAVALDQKGAVYAYNDTDKAVNVSPKQSDSDRQITKGWNLLAAREVINKDSLLEIDGQTNKISEYIATKKISASVYVLTSSSSGVSRKKIDLLSESIPAKSAYWLFVLD